MFHYLLFVMSLSGSVVFILYGLTYPTAQRYFPHSWRKSILCLSLFFYLVPVPLIEDSILKQLGIYFPFKTWNYGVRDGLSINPRYTINIKNGQFSLGPGVIAVYIVTVCMLVIAAVIIIKQVRQYIRICRRYRLKAFCEAAPSQLTESFQKVEEALEIKRPVNLVCSKLCDTPMTIGILSPTIVFPTPNKMDLASEDYQYILRHELLHINNRDLLIKFLGLFTLVIHWYNPICYLLYHELCIVSELDCDHSVTKDLDDAQRQRYGNLLLDLAVSDNGKKGWFSVGLVDNEAASFERRILEMKRIRKKSKPFLACIVMAVICIMGIMTAFAYEAPIRYGSEYDWTEFDDIFFSNHPEAPEHFIYDYFFVDQNGNIIPLDDTAPQASCDHDFKTGQVTRHTKSSDGSCVITYYTAQRCIICGDVKDEELVNEIRYLVCPH